LLGVLSESLLKPKVQAPGFVRDASLLAGKQKFVIPGFPDGLWTGLATVSFVAAYLRLRSIAFWLEEKLLC
jgi:hypothetical protein